MIRRMLAWMVGCWVAATAAVEGLAARSHGAPYVPTPDGVVEEMLDIARVEPGDYVVDLGSGDGRVVIQAAQRGAHGHGVELNRALVREARSNAERAGVGDRVTFLEEDLFETDLSQASVVAIYLLPDRNLRLRPRFLQQLRPGTRVVSHGFGMGKWGPDKSIGVAIGPCSMRSVHLWLIPADVAGLWQWQVDGRRFSGRIDQHHQELATTIEVDGRSFTPADVELRGRCIALSAESEGVRYQFTGRVNDGRIAGTVKVSDGAHPRVLEWSARKMEADQSDARSDARAEIAPQHMDSAA